MNNKSNIKMEYPTWEDISKGLSVTPNNTPSSIYGEEAFVFNYNPKWVYNSVGYNESLVGIDIPVLLRPDNQSKKEIIVILGESPLRNDKDKDKMNNIVFGLPYAVHMVENNPTQSRMYKKIFKRLLDEGYSLYLTDIVKVWWKNKKLNPSSVDIDLFKKELKILQKNYEPNRIVIVAFGKKAEDAANNIKAENIIKAENVICLPHPSRMNWNTWKLRIFEKAVYNNNPSYAIEKYPHKDSSTNENIVCDEVIQEILDNL